MKMAGDLGTGLVPLGLVAKDDSALDDLVLDAATAVVSEAAEALRLTAAAPPRPTPSGGDYE